MTVLEASQLAVFYGNFKALDGASLAVRPGEFHGLIGPNGSGKSTFMKSIAGTIRANAGSVAIDGRDVTALGPAGRARAGLSIKFQITSVMPALTLFDNVLLAAQARLPTRRLLARRLDGELSDRVMKALAQFKLDKRAFDRASALSHGEQQWLEIAMALATEPHLLLLDEPTAGMSVEERRMTGDLLRGLRDRLSIVIVEHDLDFVRDLCDRLSVLDQGKVLCCGSVAEVQANPDVQKVYLRRV